MCPRGVHSRVEYHEQAPLSLTGAADDDRSLIEVLASSGSALDADPRQLLSARCTMEVHRQLLEQEALAAQANRPARKPRVLLRTMPTISVRWHNAKIASLVIDFSKLGLPAAAPAPRMPRPKQEPIVPLRVFRQDNILDQIKVAG